MAQTIPVKNAVPVIAMEEIIIGSQFKFALQFEKLISENPDVFEPFNFTGMTLKADIKNRPSKEIEADAEFVCTPRVSGGWVDLFLNGTVSGTLTETTYYCSLKVWPTAFPEQGDTLLVITLPMKYKATR